MLPALPSPAPARHAPGLLRTSHWCPCAPPTGWPHNGAHHHPPTHITILSITHTILTLVTPHDHPQMADKVGLTIVRTMAHPHHNSQHHPRHPRTGHTAQPPTDGGQGGPHDRPRHALVLRQGHGLRRQHDGGQVAAGEWRGWPSVGGLGARVLARLTCMCVGKVTRHEDNMILWSLV